MVFDWDGVLFDSVDLNYESTAEVLRAFGLIPASREEFSREMTSDYLRFYRERGLPPNVKPEELDTIRRRYLEQHWNDYGLNPGATKLLSFCAKEGIAVAIVTSEEPAILERRLWQFSIREFFREVRPAATDRRGALTETLQKLGVLPEDALYVDDVASGVRAAKSLGITTIGVSCGFNSHAQIMEAKPDHPKDGLPILDLSRIIDIIEVRCTR